MQLGGGREGGKREAYFIPTFELSSATYLYLDVAFPKLKRYNWIPSFGKDPDAAKVAAIMTGCPMYAIRRSSI